MQIKIATLNTEWMVNLFYPKKAQFWPLESKSTGLGSKPKDVPLVCQRLAGAIRDVNPDILGIQEGPPLKRQMELFVRQYLNDEYKVYSMPDGAQSVHALVRKTLALPVEQLKSTHPIYRHIARKVEYYTWGEVEKARLEKFTRKPVVLRLDWPGQGCVELMVFHTKSKISKLKQKSQYTSRDKPAMIDALRSRQKLSAEMAVVRRYLTHAILAKRAVGCILVGDLNDGPHRDVFEEKFLIHSIVDELRGAFNREAALMHHGLPQSLLANDKEAYSAEFPDPTQDGKIVQTLLDHILVTTSVLHGTAPLKLVAGSGRIEHAAYTVWTVNNGRSRDDRPSDHRPVSAIFEA